MGVKVYQTGQSSTNFSFVLPSGLTLASITSMNMVIKKPDNTEMTKSLTNSNIVSGTNNISITVTSDMSDLEGVYDYNIVNTSSSKNEIGPTLQYWVFKNIAGP